jgi:hypothetical protein
MIKPEKNTNGGFHGLEAQVDNAPGDGVKLPPVPRLPVVHADPASECK